MPDSKSISELTTAEQTTANDLFETSLPNGSLGYLSRKVTLEELANFIVNVRQYASALITTSKTIIGAINEVAQAGGVNANDNIADAYDATATYSVGDYCIYNNTLYKCNTAISTAEAWNSNHWTSTVIADELGQGGSSAHNYSTTEQVVGTWIDGSTVYEKTYTSSIYYYTSAAVILDLSSLAYDKIISLQVESELIIEGEGTMHFMPSGDSAYINSDKKVYAKQSLAMPQSGRTMMNYITIRYTKTSS